MARLRTIKPDACTSETLAQVPRAYRWTFATLWTHCDDEGRAVHNLRLIKAALYPLDDDVTTEVLGGELKALAQVGALCMYEVDGKPYLHVPAWHEHQHPNRPLPSKLPQCPKTDHSPTTHTQRTEPAVSLHGALIPVVVEESRGEVVVEEGAQARTAPRRGTRLNPDWRPTDEARAWTLQHLDQSTAATELEKFRNHWIAKTGKDATKLDWDRTWRNWVLNSNGRPRSPQQQTDDLFDRAAVRMGVAP